MSGLGIYPLTPVPLDLFDGRFHPRVLITVLTLTHKIHVIVLMFLVDETGKTLLTSVGTVWLVDLGDVQVLRVREWSYSAGDCVLVFL